MNRFAQIRQSFRRPGGGVRLLPMTSGTHGFGQEVQLPELPGYVTKTACDATVANTVKSEHGKAAGFAIGALLLGFMFGRATKG